MKLIIAALLFARMTGLVAAVETSAPTITIHPTKDDTMLLNPGKGWVQYGDSSNPQYTRDYIGLIYYRPNWSRVEPKEHEYNWKALDTNLDKYNEKSIYGRKKVAFGVINIDGGMGYEYSIPKWVFDAGAEPLAIPESTSPTKQMIINKRWDDPVFLQKFNQLVKALGERYDGNPNIAFIEIRSYGNWGEGHIGGLGSQVQLASPEVLKEDYFMPYFKAFPHTRLMIPWGNPAYDKVYDWAVSQGAGMRRDGILSEWSKDGSECLRAYGHAPAVFEYCDSYETTKKKGYWSTNLLMKYIQAGKPSYMQWDSKIFEENREFCLQLGNKIGYHFILQQATIPTKISPDAAFSIEWQWFNDGVAPLYEPCHVAIALLDEKDQVVQKQWLTDSHPKNWKPDESCTETVSATFSSVPSGIYKLAVGLFLDRGDAAPAYRLGIQGRTTQGWYVLNDRVKCKL